MGIPALAITATYFGTAIVTALVPWVNAEVLMVSAIPVARSRPQLLGIVVAVAAGQMVGKSVVYWLSRQSVRPAETSRWWSAIERWRDRCQRRPVVGFGLMFLSAVTGVPPFFVTAIAAGAVPVPFGTFLLIGTTGRLVHFGAIALASELAWAIA